MENRIRYLDKAFVWLMSIVMLVPTILGFVGSVTNYAEASTGNVVDSVLYDGPDGSATVQASLNPEGTHVNWTVNMTKHAIETPTAMKLEIDTNGGGLGAPYDINTNLAVASKEGIVQIQGSGPALEAESNTITFTTDVTDTSLSELSLRLLAETMGEDVFGSVTIHTSPLTQVFSFAAPVPIVEEPAAVEEAITEPPAPVEETAEVVEAAPPPVEEVVEEEAPEAPVVEDKAEVEASQDMIAPMALTEYNPDSGTLALDVQLTGSSINTHTVPVRLWTYDDYVYLAIKSTHHLDGATLRGEPLEIYMEHAILEHIVIDGTEYAPEEGLQGNTKDSRFTIFRILRSSLGDFNNPEYAFYVDGIGNGHDVGGTFVVIIPMVKANLTKTWNGGPMEPIEIDLLRNDLVYETFTLQPEEGTNTATKSWDALPYTDATGVPYIYDAQEHDPGDGYTVAFSSSYDSTTLTYTFTLVNTYTSPLMDIPVDKIWDDADNQDGKRPETILVQLLQDGTEYGEPLALTGPEWTNTFVDVPMTDNNGVPYVYTIEELTFTNGYTAEIVAAEEGGFTITNSYTPETTSLSGSKIWDDADDQDGKRPESVIVTLWADGEATAQTDTITAPDWDYAFTGLPKYRDQGIEIVYTVVESAVPDYDEPEYTQTEYGYDITNSYTPETMAIPVTKSWSDNDDYWGLRPAEITVNLYQDDLLFDTLTLTALGDWAGTFEGLPVYHDQGTAHVYRVEEVPVDNYDSTVDGYDIHNELKVGSLEITKVDKSNPMDPILLDGAKFQLLNDKEEVVAEGTTVDGVLLLDYLPYGTYTLVEVEAPDGYQLPNGTWEITIDDDGENDPDVKIEIANRMIQVLPNTGGSGTLLFTVVGLFMMLGAGLTFNQSGSNRKGKNKMSRLSKFIGTILMAMFVMLGALKPMTASAVVEKPEVADLIIHKMQFNMEEIPGIEDHDGTELMTPPGSMGLDGITFDIYKVADDATSTDTPMGDPTRSGTTAGGGLLTFNDLPMGRYLVVENTEMLPHGVNHTSPSFLVDVPMTNPDGDGWLDPVHVYPKNRLILATADLYKYFEDRMANPDVTATFGLYDSEDHLLETKTVSSNDTSGRIIFDNGGLGLEVGTYYVQEISVDDPYGLDATKIPFTVTNGDHDADLTDELVTIHLMAEDTFDNYIITVPEKINTDDDDDDYSADWGEIVNWNIDIRIPANIEDYEMFTFTDELDSRLDYAGGFEILVDGVPVEGLADVTQPAMTGGGTLIVDFYIGELAKYAGDDLTISFDTKINETALMGEEIPNNFTFDFDNGSQIGSKTMEMPPYTQTGGAMFDKTSSDTAVTDLSGAEFWVYRMNAETKEYLQTDRSWSAANADPMELVSAADGTFEIMGLSFGTYYLEERVALPGHMLPGTDFEFEVSAETYHGAHEYDVLNKPQIRLPETGGMGTIAFTLAGLGLMAGAVKLYRKEGKE
ncbi:Cna B-type domain-containing protein [Jeotgalibaca sp. A127]|uniref:Cna B-type domain-containing protein n=1 Tax=Jeotgalibaca sp. A127 TaxID=3457324 RepID=UPI003FD498B6